MEISTNPENYILLHFPKDIDNYEEILENVKRDFKESPYISTFEYTETYEIITFIYIYYVIKKDTNVYQTKEEISRLLSKYYNIVFTLEAFTPWGLASKWQVNVNEYKSSMSYLLEDFSYLLWRVYVNLESSKGSVVKKLLREGKVPNKEKLTVVLSECLKVYSDEVPEDTYLTFDLIE